MQEGIAGFGIANIDFIFGNSPRMPRLGEEIYSESCPGSWAEGLWLR